MLGAIILGTILYTVFGVMVLNYAVANDKIELLNALQTLFVIILWPIFFVIFIFK